MNITKTSNAESKDINELIHDARAPLNRISMQAELIKLVLENNMPVEKALEATDKIINSCQECSQFLEVISNK
tara:strand:- start:3329 stop:3547 length:219 start_codon:yes stop_codon:yes gene_type:complete